MAEIEIDNPILDPQDLEREDDNNKDDNQAFLVAYGLICLYLIYRFYLYMLPDDDPYGLGMDFTSAATGMFQSGGAIKNSGPIRAGFNNVKEVMSEFTFE